ncbi:MAG: hypothetical protein AAGD38_18645 [Acidobacteriota bacterium]
MKNQDQFPPGWNGQRVREVLDYYESQTDEEAVTEHEQALSSPEHTLMEIPVELLPVVRQLIAEHQREQASDLD